MVYYGLSMNPTVLGGDRYVTFVAAAALEIPALIVVYLTIDRIGRKPLLSACYLLTSVCLISTLVIPDTPGMYVPSTPVFGNYWDSWVKRFAEVSEVKEIGLEITERGSRFAKKCCNRRATNLKHLNLRNRSNWGNSFSSLSLSVVAPYHHLCIIS